MVSFEMRSPPAKGVDTKMRPDATAPVATPPVLFVRIRVGVDEVVRPASAADLELYSAEHAAFAAQAKGR